MKDLTKLIGRTLLVAGQNEDNTFTVAEATVCDCGKLACVNDNYIGFYSQAGLDKWIAETRPVIVRRLPPLLYAVEGGGAECDACAKAQPQTA